MIHQQDISVKDLKHLLFSHPFPPEPKSMVIEVEFEDHESTLYHFLSELFEYGIRTKYPDIPRSQLTIKHFENIRNYIRACGYDSILHYRRSLNGDVLEELNIEFIIMV
jgi:hypothetical protein